MKRMCLLLMLFLTPQPALSQTETEKENSKILATNLVECAGLYQALGQVLSEMGKENAGQTYVDTARGAYLAGAYLQFMMKNIAVWENALFWGENIKETHSTYWLGLIEMMPPSEDGPFPDTFMEKLGFCASINSEQTALVNEMRDFLSSQDETIQ